MKKAFYFLTAFSFLAVSCSKEGFEPTSTNPTADPGRLTVVTGNDLDGGIVPINETFTISGKASQLSYTYKVYAESPIVNGLQTAATAARGANNYVFVSWHTEGNPTGGSIAAYSYNGIEYSYVARVDFDDTDWHDLIVEAVSANQYTIYLAGQREPDSSGYLLATHRGAVAGKITFDNTNPASSKFEIDDYQEIPLESFGANGIARSGANIVVVTGNGTGSASPAGGAYTIDATSFEFVTNKTTLVDGEYLTIDASTNLIALERSTASSITAFASFNNGATFTARSSSGTLTTLDNERNTITGYNAGANDGILLALGENGVYYLSRDGANNYAGSSFTLANDLGSAAIGVDWDATNQVIYAAAGGGGLHVLADADYANGKALVDEFDLIGKFIPPTQAPFNANFVVKDINVYSANQLAIASGNGGMFFVEQN